MNTKLTTTKKLILTGLCVAMILGCAGIQTAFAQDYEAVGRRLRAAVAAGEITGQQARAMLGALKKGADKKDIDIDAIGKKIRAAVQAGEITKEEAKAKWAAIKKKGDGKKDIDIDAIGRKIRAAVAAGEMTAEEGRAKMATIKKGTEKKIDGGERAREYLRQVRKELGEAVEAGKISEEDAKKKFASAEKAVREKMAAGRGERGERGITLEEYKRAEAKMRKMIEEGKAKPEDVERRLIEMRKIMGDQGEPKRKARDIDWEGIKRRIEGAVKSGKMTPEEADAKYKEIKERNEASHGEKRERNPRAAYAEAEKKIKAAIESGRITEEQGKEKLAGLRKRLAGSGRRGRSRDR